MPRLSRRLQRRLWKIAVLIFILIDFLNILSTQYALRQVRLVVEHSDHSKVQKIYISSTHWNNEYVLRTYWIDSVVALAKHFGPGNVYISVYESGSWDDSKGALRQLDALLDSLHVNRTIVLDETTHADEIAKQPASTGWIATPRGKTELRRIPYLSRMRNLSLKPLEDLATKGMQFDKILFLNDVVFTTRDVETLLHTNDGMYSAACALDFSKPPKYYDTFALRDANGDQPITQTWPYFQSSKSRSALKAARPVPVKSCWNGMVFMDAHPFYSSTSTPTPLRFRGVPDRLAAQHLEGSECCLIHADNTLSASEGVWLNPNVRVGYDGPAYDAVNPADGRAWLSLADSYLGLWRNRISRWWPVNWATRFAINWVVDRRLRLWKKEGHSQLTEPGRYCLINEMQVLVHNGWAHV